MLFADGMESIGDGKKRWKILVYCRFVRNCATITPVIDTT